MALASSPVHITMLLLRRQLTSECCFLLLLQHHRIVEQLPCPRHASLCVASELMDGSDCLTTTTTTTTTKVLSDQRRSIYTATLQRGCTSSRRSHFNNSRFTVLMPVCSSSRALLRATHNHFHPCAAPRQQEGAPANAFLERTMNDTAAVAAAAA